MLKESDGYYRGGSCKYKLTIHLCLVTKFRYKIFYGSMITDLKKIITEICEENDWFLQIMKTDKDHIHILIDYKQTETVSSIVRKIKQYSTWRLWKIHPELRNTYRGKRLMLWSGGYFTCSIGDASNETIKKYIENQG